MLTTLYRTSLKAFPKIITENSARKRRADLKRFQSPSLDHQLRVERFRPSLQFCQFSTLQPGLLPIPTGTKCTEGRLPRPHTGQFAQQRLLLKTQIIITKSQQQIARSNFPAIIRQNLVDSS